MSNHENNHHERESTANFLETNFLHQAERHFDHVNAATHDMRHLLLFSSSKESKDHKTIVMRAMNKMHDQLDFIRKLEADHPEFKKEINQRGDDFMKAHQEAVQGCVKLRRLHTDIHNHHHEKFLPAVIKMQCAARRKHLNERVAKRVRLKNNKKLLRVATKKMLASKRGPQQAKEMSLRMELLKAMCRGEHIDDVESLLRTYLMRIGREMQCTSVKAVTHKYIKHMHVLEARTRAVTMLSNRDLGHLKSFRNPSKDVVHIIRGMLICLGESENDLTDWTQCKVVLHKTGKFSLLRRVRDFDVTPLKATKMQKVQDQLILAVQEMQMNSKLNTHLETNFEHVEEHVALISKNSGTAVAAIYSWGRHVCHCVLDLREEARLQLRNAGAASKGASAAMPRLKPSSKQVTNQSNWVKKSDRARSMHRLINRNMSFKQRMQQIRTDDDEATVDDLLNELA